MENLTAQIATGILIASGIIAMWRWVFVCLRDDKRSEAIWLVIVATAFSILVVRAGLEAGSGQPHPAPLQARSATLAATAD